MVRTVSTSRRSARSVAYTAGSALAPLVTLVALIALSLIAMRLDAQSPTRPQRAAFGVDQSVEELPPPTVAALGACGATASPWRSPPMRLASVLVAGALAVLPYDGRWTTSLQAPRFQGNATLHSSATVLRTLGDPGALVLSASLLAAGRLSRRPGLGDAGWHATEAVVAGGLTTLAFKTLVGRQRPSAVIGPDADEFRVGRGYRPEYASMPSGHTTVAFAAAAAFGAELSRSHPSAARIVTPILYTTAAGVGLSRLYNNQHWASDAIVAAAVGQLVGRGVVAISHRSRPHREAETEPERTCR